MFTPHRSTLEYEVVIVDGQGQGGNRQKRQAEYRTEVLGKGVNLELVRIPGGRFQMGSPEREGEPSEWPQHPVTIKSFWMGRRPVTQDQWKEVAGLPKVGRDLDPDPSFFKGSKRPVELVSWYDAEEFCKRISKKTGREYRLPSEAEWEYACRAGTQTPFHFGETITTDLANYRGTDLEYEGITYPGFYGNGPRGNYRRRTTDVGSFGVANGFGLYDMHGNVWEWCLDYWHQNYEGAPPDGGAWETGEDDAFRLACGKSQRMSFISDDDSFRLLRGGAWAFLPESCRSASRLSHRPDERSCIIGLRVVCVSREPLMLRIVA